jgi:hypothetical protein
MKDEMAILIASSIYIKAFAVCLSLALCALIFELSGGGDSWERAYDGFIFLSLFSILLEFVDDRRECTKEQRDEWMLNNQNDTGREK